MNNCENPPAVRKSIRIGTWNVEYAHNARNSDRLALLVCNPADIWILTETHSSLDLSSTHTPYRSAPRPITHNKIDAESTWVTIWSRYELCERIDVPDPRRQVAAIFNTTVGKVSVAGVVLPWHADIGDEPAKSPPAEWDEHRRVIGDEMPDLLERLFSEKDCRHVLAGDFNTVLASPGYWAGPECMDALNALLLSNGLAAHTMHIPYLNPPYNWLPQQNLIDHICTDFRQAQSLTTWVGDDGLVPRLSDHPGVVVTLLA